MSPLDSVSSSDTSVHVEAEDKVSYYCSMTKLKFLFDLFMKTLAPYITPERLLESLHSFETQLNETLNNVVARYAPKNRSYGTTMTLSNRIAIIVGIHNIGHIGYWSEVFKRIGLRMMPDLQTNLERMDRLKDWKRKYNNTTEVKVRRVKSKNEKMQVLVK